MHSREIIGLPVETRRGTPLGKVTGIEIDVKNHAVQKYYVASRPSVKKILSHQADLEIAPSQVLSVSTDKMIVVDLETTDPVDAFDVLDKGKVKVLGGMRLPQSDAVKFDLTAEKWYNISNGLSDPQKISQGYGRNW